MINKIEKGFTLMDAVTIALTIATLAVVSVKVCSNDKPSYKSSNGK